MARGRFGSGRVQSGQDKAAKNARVTKPAAPAGAALAKLADKGATALKEGPSPNPMTNLVITDIAIRVSGTLIRHAVERTMLGKQYTPEKAREIVKGRTMAQTLIGTTLARMATRSAPGAVLVGGGLLAKSLYDRSRGRRAAQVKGERAIAEQAQRGSNSEPDKNSK